MQKENKTAQELADMISAEIKRGLVLGAA